jgi:hypothetical protein
MAETKTKKASNAKRPSSSRTKRPRAKAKSRPQRPAATRKGTPRKQSAKKQSSRGAARTTSTRSKASPAKAVTKAVGEVGKDAGQATGEAVRKARLPLLAGGAAVAGTVGGVVLGATRSGGKVMGVKLPAPKRVKIRSKDLAAAAKEIGRFGENVGDLTTELRRAREGLANGNGHGSSPIEVLLRGLTNRR